MSVRIGVDGGGTKTECILTDASGRVLARRVGPGCNPSLVGRRRARALVRGELRALQRRAGGRKIAATLLCMAGAPAFWREVAAELRGFGRVRAVDDSRPVLELATGGGPGLVLHAGTGSFVAARSPSGKIHYAGGLGWRFGDPGSGHDLGRRAVARALLELQGWAPRSGLTALVRQRTGLADAPAITRHFYGEASPHAEIAALAPGVLRLAARGDRTARRLVADSVAGLAGLAEAVAGRLFPGRRRVRAGLSGRILAHPVSRRALRRSGRLRFAVVAEAPIEGVRRMLARGAKN